MSRQHDSDEAQRQRSHTGRGDRAATRASSSLALAAVVQAAGQPSPTRLAGSNDLIFRGGQFLERKWPTAMQLLSADTHFRAKAESTTTDWNREPDGAPAAVALRCIGVAITCVGDLSGTNGAHMVHY